MIFGLGKKALNIPKAVYDEMLSHAIEAYPHECCGVIVGSALKDKRAFAVHRATNTNTERAHDRYVLDPRELNLIDKMARAEGLDVLGFYHSHPDHPDRPSEFDRANGQAGYSYVIIAVNNGKDVSVKSWIFDEDDKPFGEEKLKVV